MRLWVLLIMVVIFLSIEQSNAQAGSQPPSFAREAITELPDSPMPSTESVKPQENRPAFLPVGEDPENRLGISFLKHFALDQERSWTAPFHLNAHHDPEGGGTAGGTVEKDSDRQEDSDKGERVRNPVNMGSPYVPLDSWIYF